MLAAAQDERDYRSLRELARQLLTQPEAPAKSPAIRRFIPPAELVEEASSPGNSEQLFRQLPAGTRRFTPPPAPAAEERTASPSSLSPIPQPSAQTSGQKLNAYRNSDQENHSPEIRELRGLKTIEIKKAMAHIKGGTLRPPFHVPPTANRVGSLEEALDFARQLLPLPQEMQLTQKPAHRSWLLAQIRRCSTQKRLSDFAFSLNYKDLASLFPALATLKRGEEMDRLISIIMMRASKYLYIQGWMTLQYAYPRSTVQKGLAEVCRLLETQTVGNSGTLNTEQISWFSSLKLGEEHFDWNSLPLISEISLPNTRHFLAAIVRYIRESEISGEDFFKRYGIYRDLPLGQAIKSEWDMLMFEGSVNREHFPVRHFFRDESI